MANFENVLTNFDKSLRGIKICVYSYFDLKKTQVVVGGTIFPKHYPIDENGKILKSSHIMEYAK